MTLSKNGAAVVVFLFAAFSISVTEAQAIEFIAAAGQLVSFILMVWNQAQRADVKWFVFKK